jgi:EAL and modified HD-GYP domain-containing signal transduction protein
MGLYLGRQPILDRERNVAGYELLFRSSQANFHDSAAATSQVISDAISGLVLHRLPGGKPAFINFDRTLLLGNRTKLLPPGESVIELIEAVQPDTEVLSACSDLRQQGYALALDGCSDDERTEAFAPFVDILKIDLSHTSMSVQETIVPRYRKSKMRMVATKVETEPEFQSALKLGYDYFQGYLFAPPTIPRTGKLSASSTIALHMIRQIQRQDLNYLAIWQLIERDVSFSDSLFKYVHSAAFSWADDVESSRQALMSLGADEIRRWAWTASLSAMGVNPCSPLMSRVLMRGRFCETIARAVRPSLRESDAFLLGVLSLVETLLDRVPLEIYDDLGIEADPLSLILRIVKSHEAGDWNDVEEVSRVVGLSEEALNACYLDSLWWVDAALAYSK